MAVRAETQVDLARVNDGTPGANGATFTPAVDASGNISWTNDGGLPNPATQNIKGPQGDEGPQGPQGPTGPAGPGISYVTLTTGADLNTCIGKDTIYVTSSTAVCTSLLNAPTGKPDGELQLEVQWLGDNNYIVQRLTCKNGAVRKVYLRTYSAGTFGEWTEEGVSYGTSSTAASTAAKTATISNWNRDSDPYVAIKFTNENTASSPTLNINSTGAASIMTNGSNSAYWAAGATVNFYWDGTYYQVANSPVYASTVTVGNPSGDNVFIGNSAVQVKQGSTVEAEFKATEASLGGNKAKVKYIEGTAFGVNSHRVVVCKSSDDAGVRNDATLSSRDVSTYNNNYMAFANVAHYSDSSWVNIWALTPNANSAEIDMIATSSNSGITLAADKITLNGDVSTDDLETGNIDTLGSIDTTGNITASGYIRDTVETQTLSVATSFNLYTAGEDITLKRSGNYVDLSGAVKPKNSITGSATEYTICTIPSGYRPSQSVCLIMPGSNQYKWLLRVNTDGSVTFSRYSASTSYSNAGTTTWLPFHATWVLG